MPKIIVDPHRVLRLYFALALAGFGIYLLIFGASAFAGVVDVYLDYSLSIAFTQINLDPLPFTLNLMTVTLIAGILVAGSIYLFIQSWEELKVPTMLKTFFQYNEQHKEEVPDQLPTPAVIRALDEEPIEPDHLKDSQKQLEESKKPDSMKIENLTNVVIGMFFLILGFYLVILVSNTYFLYAPQSLNSFITWRMFNLNLPIIVMIFIGILLWSAGWFLIKEAKKEIKYLEDTQLAYQLRTNSKPKKK